MGFCGAPASVDVGADVCPRDDDWNRKVLRNRNLEEEEARGAPLVLMLSVCPESQLEE